MGVERTIGHTFPESEHAHMREQAGTQGGHGTALKVPVGLGQRAMETEVSDSLHEFERLGGARHWKHRMPDHRRAKGGIVFSSSYRAAEPRYPRIHSSKPDTDSSVSLGT